jgi:hypothetical protein
MPTADRPAAGRLPSHRDAPRCQHRGLALSQLAARTPAPLDAARTRTSADMAQRQSATTPWSRYRVRLPASAAPRFIAGVLRHHGRTCVPIDEGRPGCAPPGCRCRAARPPGGTPPSRRSTTAMESPIHGDLGRVWPGPSAGPPQAGPHPHGGSADVPIGRGAVSQAAVLKTEGPAMGVWVRVPRSPPVSCLLSSAGPRAPAYEAGGRTFESCRRRQSAGVWQSG